MLTLHFFVFMLVYDFYHSYHGFFICLISLLWKYTLRKNKNNLVNLKENLSAVHLINGSWLLKNRKKNKLI